MHTHWDLMEEAHARQARRLAAAGRARLRAGAPRLPDASFTLRTAALLRQVADHLENQDRLRRFSTR